MDSALDGEHPTGKLLGAGSLASPFSLAEPGLIKRAATRDLDLMSPQVSVGV